MKYGQDRLPLDKFLEERVRVLDTWSTGGEAADIEATVAYQSAIPDGKRFSSVLAAAAAAGHTLTQPRAGVCLPADLIKLLRHLQDAGEADLLPTTIDSYTRQNRYTEARQGIEESIRSERSMLNGFPAVNFGVGICRQVTSGVDRPIQVRHGTPDARLLAEITMAGGFTAFEGGGISYNIPYAKQVPLERSLRDWQYVDRLIGWLAERGVRINREPFGPLTGTLVPPSVVLSVGILEALLAAEQGALCITVGYGQCGALFQDLAAMRALRTLARDYLDRFGFGAVALTTVFHQWMGGFPADEARAMGVIAWGAAAAGLAGATKVITKSPHEALGVPTADANAAGLRATRQVLRMIEGQPSPESPDIAEEQAWIEAETRALLETALRLGEGRFADAAARAFQAGALDVPFAPSRAALGAVLPARDARGAVRWLDPGRLALTTELKSRHRAALEDRARRENRSVSFQMVTDDIYAVSKGQLVGRSSRGGAS